MKKELLRIENIKKGTLLKRIELQIFEGEIVHCIFDNIQEKNMFLSIISGEERADYGRLYYEEQSISEEGMQGLLGKRIAVVSRESRLIDSVSMEENIFLIRPGVSSQWVKQKNFRMEASKLFEEFSISINIEKSMSSLTVFERVQVEVMKAYLLEKRLIVITALSNCLSDQEMKKLWELLEKLRSRNLSFLVVEPLEDMNFIYTDTVAVIKHGKTCIVKDVDECDYTTLHTVLYRDEIEKNVDDWKLKQEENNSEKVAIKNITTQYLKDVSLSVAKGEIVKLFCIDEQSYDEIISFLKGETEAFNGTLHTGGSEKEIKKTLKGLKDRIGIVSGNPGAASLFAELTAMDNLQMLLSRKVPGMWLIPKYKRSIRRLLGDIIPEDVYGRLVKDLSPSEVQKIVYCRWLIYSPQLLVCIQPFAEGDIQARETARDMLYLLEDRGIPILIVTSNTAELNYCRGREIYMRHGRIIQKEEAYQFLYSEP